MDATTFGAVMAQIRNGILDGSVTIVACQEFPEAFDTDGTTLELCQSIVSCTDAHAGIIYTGAVTLSDMPFNGNAELRAWTIRSSLGGFILSLELISATENPYFWSGVYWNNNFTGWLPFMSQADAEALEEATEDAATAALSANTAAASVSRYHVTNNLLYVLTQAQLRAQQKEIDDLKTAVAALT